MILKTVFIFLLAILAGIGYRMGGSANYWRWIRPTAMAVFTVITLILLGYFHGTLILTAGVTYAASTSYFKKSGEDAHWWNFVCVGLAFGLSVLPTVLAFHLYSGFAIRAVGLGIVMPLWCLVWSNKLAYHFRKVWDDSVIEEFGRGAICILTLPLLVI